MIQWQQKNSPVVLVYSIAVGWMAVANAMLFTYQICHHLHEKQETTQQK